MKRGFVRALWGIYDKGHRITKRRYWVDRNIKSILNNKYNELFKVYVFGKDNYINLNELGFDCVLVDEDPAPFNLIDHQYRHKLELIKCAMEDFDEIVYMDWDCVPQKKIPFDFWDQLGSKEKIQANLQMYHRRKAYWRKEDLRKVPNGGYIYLRDSSYPDRAIDWWHKLGEGDNDEPAWARLMDELTDGWKGMELYWDKFEAMHCNLHKNSPFDDRRVKNKDQCFLHYQGGR